MMSVFSRAGAGIQNILSEWRQPASRSSLHRRMTSVLLFR